MAKYRVCAEGEIPVNGLLPVKIEGEGVIVYHLPDGYYATQSNCTHIFAPLRKGKIVDNCNIECPLHKARFNIKTGEVVEWANFPPGIQLLNVVRKEKALKVYPVSIEAGEVFIEH